MNRCKRRYGGVTLRTRCWLGGTGRSNVIDLVDWLRTCFIAATTRRLGVLGLNQSINQSIKILLLMRNSSRKSARVEWDKIHSSIEAISSGDNFVSVGLLLRRPSTARLRGSLSIGRDESKSTSYTSDDCRVCGRQTNFQWLVIFHMAS